MGRLATALFQPRRRLSDEAEIGVLLDVERFLGDAERAHRVDMHWPWHRAATLGDEKSNRTNQYVKSIPYLAPLGVAVTASV